jgi:hypothetical protein
MVGELKGNKQMFDVTFPDGVRRGMGFDGHVKYPVVATRNGSTISERDWSRLSAKAKAKLVFDDLPDSVRAPRVPSASDAEHRIEMLRHYLRGRGLDEESCDQACELARRELTLEEEPVEDELPTSGPGGARNLSNSQAREPGTKVFRSPGRFESRPPLGTTSSSKERSMLGGANYRSSPASDGFARRYPDAMRISAAVPGHSQFDGQNDRRSRRQRQLAADAALPDAADRLSQKFGEHFAAVGVGDFPRRR